MRTKACRFAVPPQFIDAKASTFVRYGHNGVYPSTVTCASRLCSLLAKKRWVRGSKMYSDARFLPLSPTGNSLLEP